MDLKQIVKPEKGLVRLQGVSKVILRVTQCAHRRHRRDPGSADKVCRLKLLGMSRMHLSGHDEQHMNTERGTLGPFEIYNKTSAIYEHDAMGS